MKKNSGRKTRFQQRRTLRLTVEEDDRLSRQAATAGISVSEYMRRLFFGGRPIVAKTDGQTIRELRLSVGPGQEALERQLLRQLGLTAGGGAAAVTVTFGPQAREGCAVYLTPDCARRQRVDYIWRDGESPAPEEPLLAALHRAGRLPDVGVKSAETLDIGP